MQTLRRIGSLRASYRRPSRSAATATTGEAEAAADFHEQTTKEDLPCDAAAKASLFTLSCTDVVVASASEAFQPTHLRIIIHRHRKSYTSNHVLWEPSLKCHSTGAGVWHPPFVVQLSISPPLRSKSTGTLKHKDAFISLENIDLKHKKKLLAKARVNLSDYYEPASNATVTFKLKLFPESSKVASAFLHLAIHRTEEAQLVSAALDEPSGSQSNIFFAPRDLVRPEGMHCDQLSDNNDDDDQSRSPSPINRADISSISIKPPKTPSSSNQTSPEKLCLPDKCNKPRRPATVENNNLPLQSLPAVLLAEPEDFNIDLESGGHDECSSPDKLPNLASKTLKDALPVAYFGPLPPVPIRKAKSPSSNPSESSPVKKKEAEKDAECEEHLPFTNGATYTLDPSPCPSLVEPAPTFSLNLAVCASPKLTPYKQSLAETELLDWAKKTLEGFPQIKITNLSSSWRNGLGFCALIHQKYPDLIPMAELKMKDMKENCEIAFEAARLVGFQGNSFEVEDLMDSMPSKAVVMSLLKELRSCLHLKPLVELAPEPVLQFQCSWYRKHGFFAQQVGHIVEQESQVARDVEAEPSKECSQVSPSMESSGRKERIRMMIEEAHKEAGLNNSPDWTPDMSGCAGTVSTSAAVFTTVLRESHTISDEMAKLAQEEERLSKEKDKLESILRDENIDTKSLEATMQKLIHLVNEKNSLVRRQMQLNIAEQEKAISYELQQIQWKLQELSEMEESQKTEAMRLEEQSLLDKLVEAVNKKNELVLHLDSQEKAIVEDERIQSSLVEKKDWLALKKEEECVLQ